MLMKNCYSILLLNYFQDILSTDYLPASSDLMGDTASNLGPAMDELVRRPSLTGTVPDKKLCQLGSNPSYICRKAQAKPKAPPPIEVGVRQNFIPLIYRNLLILLSTYS